MNISTPELLQNFSAYLTGQNLSSVTIKNYVSDIRYFLDWFQTTFPDQIPLPIDQQITTQTLNYFHQFLSGSQPPKTANRRLSSVRKFCQFLSDQNYTPQNSANHLPNILPSYHLLHQIPEFTDIKHHNVPILQDIIPDKVTANPAPILPSTNYLPLLIIPLMVFIIAFLLITVLTPPSQLLIPTGQ